MRAPPRIVASRPPRDAAVFAAFAALTFVLAFALRYPSLYEPRWYGDEGIFAAVAENVRSGRTLYAQAWDNKPPLVFYTYAAIQQSFGSSVFALHAVTTAVVLTTQALVVACALALYGPRRALVAGLLFALVLGTPVIEGNLAMTETFMILPATAAVLVFLLAERRERAPLPAYAAAGVLLAVAAAYKQVAVFDALAIVVMLLLRRARPWREAGALAAGFALPQLALALVFAASGAFDGYWYAIAGSLSLYAQLGPSDGPLMQLLGFLPAVIVVAVLVRRRQQGEEVALAAFPMLWLGFALAGATRSSFPFPHYLQQAVPAAALVVVSSPLAAERDDVARLALAVAGVLVVAVVYAQFAPAFRRDQLEPVRYYRTFVAHQWGGMDDEDYDYRFDGKAVAVDDVVGYIRQDAAGRTAYTWSELPWIYAAGGLVNPTRYYTSFLGEVIPGAKQEIMRDLQADPPVYIILSDDTFAPFSELDAFLAGRYDLLHAQGDWRIYRLATATGNLTPIAPAAGESARAPVTQ